MVASRPTSTQQTSTGFAHLLRVPTTERGRLGRGVELAVAMVPGCDHASVTVSTPSYVEIAAASDDVGWRSDAWQHELSEGPSLESVRGRTTVVSQDLRSDPRWRTWGPRVADRLGVVATMSVLLDGDTDGDTDKDTDVVASLSLYADRVQVWGEQQQALALALGDQLAVAVAHARMLDDRQRTMMARAGLDQAQRIVMERLGMTAEQAFGYLQQLSDSTQIALVHLAEHVVETRELPASRPGHAGGRGGDAGRRP